MPCMAFWLGSGAFKCEYAVVEIRSSPALFGLGYLVNEFELMVVVHQSYEDVRRVGLSSILV